jgi:hypothetical protein
MVFFTYFLRKEAERKLLLKTILGSTVIFKFGEIPEQTIEQSIWKT